MVYVCMYVYIELYSEPYIKVEHLVTVWCVLCFSDVGISPPGLLQYALDDWIATDGKQFQCNLTLRCPIPDALSILQMTNSIHPTTGQIT